MRRSGSNWILPLRNNLNKNTSIECRKEYYSKNSNEILNNSMLNTNIDSVIKNM